MSLHLYKNIVIINNPFEKSIFIYDRKKRIKYAINLDMFFLLDYIGRNNNLSAIELNNIFDIDNCDEIINRLIAESIIYEAHDGNEYSYSTKYLKDINLAKLTIEITTGCNLFCKHCFGNFGKDRKDININNIYELLDSAVLFGTYELVITGGEPLLYENIGAIIDYAYNRGFIITLFSNLTLPLDVISNQFTRIDKIVTSIEANDSLIHDAFRGMVGAFDLTKAAILNLHSQGIKVFVNIVIGNHNVDYIEDTLSFLLNLNINIVTDIVCTEGRANSLKTDYKLIICRVRRLFENKMFSATEPCGMGIRSLYICGNGDIIPCASLRKNNHIFGNINTVYSLFDSFHSMKQILGETTCKNFGKNKLCNGGCRARALKESGQASGIDSIYCEITGGCDGCAY